MCETDIGGEWHFSRLTFVWGRVDIYSLGVGVEGNGTIELDHVGSLVEVLIC